MAVRSVHGHLREAVACPRVVVLPLSLLLLSSGIIPHDGCDTRWLAVGLTLYAGFAAHRTALRQRPIFARFCG